jgi:flagellar hook-associated protein 1 FlgK
VTVKDQPLGVVDVYVGTTALVRGNNADALRVDTTTTPGTTAIVWDRLGIPAAAGGKAGALQAATNTTIPAYQAQLTAVAQTLTTDVNAVHTTGFDLGGAAGVPFFQMGPGGIQVNPVIAGDPKKVAAAATATGLLDGSVAAKVADLTGPADAYRAFVLHLGIESATANRAATTQSAITEQVDGARDAASGINLDEEMANLVQIQHAYDASARFITVVDQMLETLIKNTGLVGR